MRVRVCSSRTLLFSATLFAAYADRAVSTALAPTLGERFGLTDAELGFLNGAALIVPFAAASLILGAGRWRWSPGRVMATCVVVWTLGAIGFGFAQTYPHLVAGRMVMGLGQAALLPAAVAALGSARSPNRLAWLTASSASGRSGGLLIVAALLMLATSSAAAALPVPAWRLAVLVMLVPNLILALLLWRTDDGPVTSGDDRPGPRGAITHIGGHLAAYGPYVLAASCILVIVQAVGAWMPALLVRSAGLTTAQAAATAGVLVLIGAPIGHLGAGWLSGRIRPPFIMAACSALAVMGCAIMAASVSAGGVITGLLVLVITGGGGAAAALIGLQPLAPQAIRGSVTAIYLGVVTLVAYAVGPLATGLLSDAMVGDDAGLSRALLTVVAMSGSLCVVAALGGLRAWRNAAMAEAIS